MKLLLILSLIFYLEASIISDNQLKKTIYEPKLNEQPEMVERKDKEKLMLQTITVTKNFIDCLNNTKIIPKTIINAIQTQKAIIVTKDYEYIVDFRYSNSMRNNINNAIKSCGIIEKSKGKTVIFGGVEVEVVQNERGPNTLDAGPGNENESQCNITKLEESIRNNFPKKYFAKGISLTVSQSGEIIKDDSELIEFVTLLVSQSDETHDYKIYDFIFDTNCQEKFGKTISKEEYEEAKENNTFFEE